MKNIHNNSRRNVLKNIAGLLTVSSIFPLHSIADPYKKTGNKKFVPVMLTPFHQDLSIDYEMLKRLTDFYQAAGAEGYFANCLSSEMYYLSDQERIAITQTVVDHASSKNKVVATGSFGDTLEQQIDFCKKIVDTGIHGSILITSHFAKKQDPETVMMDNLRQFIDQTGKIPLGTYECPSPYKRILSPKSYQELIDTNRFFYHKDTTEDIDQISQKIELSKKSTLAFYNAHSATALKSLQMGGSGLSPISGNFYPEILSWICKHANNPKKYEDLNWIQKEITETEPMISINYPVSAKYFLNKRGLPINILCRSNKRELTKEDTIRLDKVLNRFTTWCDRLGITPAHT